VYATEAQASALINRSEYFESHPCPVCTGGHEGYNLVFHNSNSFVYNMLSARRRYSAAVSAYHHSRLRKEAR
jgi:hypothetical protein